MRATGNTKSNEKYNPKNKPPPTTSFSGGDASEDIELERYIRDKYERKTLQTKPGPLRSPTYQGDPDKINAILGPAARSPSLGSSGSSNLKPGQRVSGDSFERARSPASTNSSVELPPAKPPRPTASTIVGNPFAEGDPWAWAELGNKGQVQTNEQPNALMNPMPSMSAPVAQEVLLSDQLHGLQLQNGQYGVAATNSYFPTSQAFSPQPQPLPQISPFSPVNNSNPFEQSPQSTGNTVIRDPFSRQLSQTIPQQSPQFQPVYSNAQQTSSYQPTILSPSLPRAATFPLSLNGSQTRQPVSPVSPHNPFTPQQPIQSPSSVSPTNPFFVVQEQSPYQAVYQQPPSPHTYQSQIGRAHV